MSIQSTDYRLYKQKDGRIGVNPFQQEVTILAKGEMVYARKKEFDRDGVKSYKLSLAVQETLADTIQGIEHELHGQYEALFIEEGEIVPKEYSNIQEFNQVKWFSLKVDPEKVKVFEKKGKTLTPRTYAEIPEEADVFPVIKLSSAWSLPINGEPKFGLSFQVTQLFFRKDIHDTKRQKKTVVTIDITKYL